MHYFQKQVLGNVFHWNGRDSGFSKTKTENKTPLSSIENVCAMKRFYFPPLMAFPAFDMNQVNL
jgi:hypothetical protein